MATELREVLVQDMERMEQAATDLTIDHRISLGKVLYWCCVAVLHVITWVLRQEDMRKEKSKVGIDTHKFLDASTRLYTDIALACDRLQESGTTPRDLYLNTVTYSLLMHKMYDLNGWAMLDVGGYRLRIHHEGKIPGHFAYVVDGGELGEPRKEG